MNYVPPKRDARLHEPYLTTFTGRKFYPRDVRIEDIHITDIAHGLSNTCRFSGQSRMFFSVAQHSVLVSRLCAPEHRLWGLLHDASEAYLCDLPSPIKHLDLMYPYRQLEKAAMNAICDRYSLPRQEPLDVHLADKIALHIEAEFCGLPWARHIDIEPEFEGRAWTPREAEFQFHKRYLDLT